MILVILGAPEYMLFKGSACVFFSQPLVVAPIFFHYVCLNMGSSNTTPTFWVTGSSIFCVWQDGFGVQTCCCAAMLKLDVHTKFDAAMEII